MICFLKATLALLLLTVNTLFWGIPLVLVSFLKFLVPIAAVRRVIGRVLVWFAENWVAVNAWLFRVLNGEKIEVRGLENVRPDQWYLVISNHQSWVDIPVLQTVFHKQIPFLKFFLKQQLIWVPVLGAVWWALDFPFMRRYSRDYLQKHPEKKGKDLEITRKACEKFKDFPISIINFVEGTRFTPEKHRQQQSPYRHLLKPKAGGVGFVLGSLGDRIDAILLVAIDYRPAVPTFMEFLCGKVDRIIVTIRVIPVPEELKNRNYITDADYRQALQQWINGLWEQQDNTLSRSSAGEQT